MSTTTTTSSWTSSGPCACCGDAELSCTDRPPASLPDTLYFTLDVPACQGGCDDPPGSGSLSKEGDPPQWVYAAPPGSGSFPCGFLSITLRCGRSFVGCTGWSLLVSGVFYAPNCNGGGIPFEVCALSGSTATPFMLIFDIPTCWVNGNCTPGTTARLIITE